MRADSKIFLVEFGQPRINLAGEYALVAEARQGQVKATQPREQIDEAKRLGVLLRGPRHAAAPANGLHVRRSGNWLRRYSRIASRTTHPMETCLLLAVRFRSAWSPAGIVTDRRIVPSERGRGSLPAALFFKYAPLYTTAVTAPNRGAA